MSDIVAFDPAKLKERISDVVKGTFLDLIPPEAFKTMVDTELKNFFEKPSIKTKVITDNYNGRMRVDREEALTPFQEMVRNEIDDLVRAKLNKELGEDPFMSDWQNNYSAGQMAKTITAELAPQMVTALFANMTQNILCDIRNNMSRH